MSSINEMFDELKKINLAEREADDRGQGLEPLIQEFVYDVHGLEDEDRIRRTRLISDYYNQIYNRTHGRADVAYKQTKRWATKVFVQHWVDKTVGAYGNPVGLGEAWKDHPDPSGFLRAAHAPENCLLVWWYNPFTGEFRKSRDPNANHKDDNVLLSDKMLPMWVRGRVFEFMNKVYLMAYFDRLQPRAVNYLRDLYDLCRRAIGKDIDVTMDMNGDDISDLFESWEAYKIEVSSTGKWSINEAINEEVVKHSYSNTQIKASKDVAEAVIKFGLEIPEEEIYTDPEDTQYGRELEPHITIKWGLTTNDPNEVENIMDGNVKPFQIVFGKMSIFSEDDQPYDVLKVDMDAGDNLNKLHKLFSELDNEDSHPEYIPHMTVAYVKKGEGKKYVGNDDFVGLEMGVDCFEFRDQEGNSKQIVLGGTEEKKKGTGRLFTKKDLEDNESELDESHSHSKCMKCDKTPTKEVLWAEGMGHAWFCDACFKTWSTTGDGKGDVCSVKEINDGKACKKFADNKNPNIKT